jgi:ABC-type glutathione transport system ATPase component
MEPFLQVRSLTIYYRSNAAPPVPAVRDVSFDIAPGEILGLMGESGCGKSSIAQALLGLLPKDRAEVAGSVGFRGCDLLTLDERDLQRIRGAAISMVYQEPEIALSPVMRVGDQVAEVIRAHFSLPWKQCQAQARAIIERVGLSEVSRIYAAYPHQLSGGQRQRVVLAQALACTPALVIADEPTAHLDARSQSEFLSLLETVKRESCISILLISHTPEIQARLADRLFVMQGGRIVEQGRFTDLYRHSVHPYTRAILGSPTTLRERAEFTLAERATR